MQANDDPLRLEMDARVKASLEDLERAHDGLAVMLVLMDPDTGNWSLAISKELLNPKQFSCITNATTSILCNMINPVRPGL